MINFDYNAITPMLSNVFEEIAKLIMENTFLNPSSTHSLGKKAKNILEESKLRIINSIHAKCHDIYFVSGATEGNNMVLNSQHFQCIFTLQTEHDSILSPASKLNTSFIRVNQDGIIDLEDLESNIKRLGSTNFLCSAMLVNNESGVIQDINKIADVVHKHGGIFHSDISCAIGKIPFNFNDYNVDIITFSGNKFYAGLGGGCVIFRSGIPIQPLILGGGQQNFKRGGTENIPQIVALSIALEYVNTKRWIHDFDIQTSALQNMLENEIMNNGGDVFGRSQKRVSNTSLIKMPNVNNLIQMMEFDLNDICVSVGSACSSGKTNISHVLLACGTSQQNAQEYIRISTSIYNTKNEMLRFLDIWKNLSKR